VSVGSQAIAEEYGAYVDLVTAVGHAVDMAAVVDFLAEDDEEQQALLDALDGNERSGPGPFSDAAQRMHDLRERLARDLCDMVAQAEGDAPDPDANGDLAKCLRALSGARREDLADKLLLNGQRQFIRPAQMDVGDLQALLRELENDEGPFALVKLVPYLREELARRGMSLDEAEIREFFKPDGAVGQAPRCIAWLLRGLNGEFRTGLIPLEDLVGDVDADRWLEEARERLLFRSHSAMHKAIAQVTSLKYDCVHKALSGEQKARRVQAEIKYCLDKWLEDADEGREPDIDDQYRGVPVEQTCALLSELESRFPTKEEMYRVLSKRTGVKAGSVRRYFQSQGQLKYAPLAVYRCALGLCNGEGEAHLMHDSYLDNERTRRVAVQLAQKAKVALREWRESGETPELELEFRELRRELIAAIKERWREVPALV